MRVHYEGINILNNKYALQHRCSGTGKTDIYIFNLLDDFQKLILKNGRQILSDELTYFGKNLVKQYTSNKDMLLDLSDVLDYSDSLFYLCPDQLIIKFPEFYMTITYSDTLKDFAIVMLHSDVSFKSVLEKLNYKISCKNIREALDYLYNSKYLLDTI